MAAGEHGSLRKNMADRLTIGLDIGATKMAFAVVDVAGTVLDETVLPTLSTQPYAQTVERIAAQLNTYLAEYPLIEGIGIGVPGPINREAGVVLNAVNLLMWDQNVMMPGSAGAATAHAAQTATLKGLAQQMLLSPAGWRGAPTSQPAPPVLSRSAHPSFNVPLHFLPPLHFLACCGAAATIAKKKEQEKKEQ